MLDIIRGKNAFLPAEAVAQHRADIMPDVAKAREIHGQITAIKRFYSERDALSALVRERRAQGRFTDEDYDTFDVWKEEVTRQLASFEVPEDRLPVIMSALLEQRRQLTNEITSRSNDVRSEALILSGVRPDMLIFHRQPLIPFEPKLMADREPKSPAMAHNDVDGTHLYHRPNLGHPLSRMVYQIARGQANRMDHDDATVAQGVGHLLPRMVFDGRHHIIPEVLRDRQEIAAGVVDATKLYFDFQSQNLIYPTGAEVGARGDQQEEYIAQWITTGVAELIGIELSASSFNERTIRQFYQSYAHQIKELAEWLGEDGYSRVGRVIEELPVVIGTIASSRLPDIAFRNAHFPNTSSATPRRIARAIRDTSMDPDPEPTRILLEKVTDRLEDNDLDLTEVAAHVASVDYREELIGRLLERANKHQRDVVMELFRGDDQLRGILRRQGLIHDMHREVTQTEATQAIEFIEYMADYQSKPKD